jgi:ATP-dependent exoDNAse (exonuclease V) beta subunit
MVGTIYPEAVLFSEKYKIAGTSDIVEDCGDYFNVLDFKTNKELNFISKYGQWLNKPVSHLSDCQYNIYALQLSIYAYMIQMQTRKKVGKLQIYYLNPQKDYTFEKINMPYLGRDAKAVLDHWLEIQKNP